MLLKNLAFIVFISIILFSSPVFAFTGTISSTFEKILSDYKADKNSIAIIYGNDKNFDDFFSAARLSSSIAIETDDKSLHFPLIKSASDIQEINQNTILIGGPCANQLSKLIFVEEGINCENWKFFDDTGLIISKQYNNYSVILVAGTQSKDTKRAVDQLLNYKGQRLLSENSKAYISREMSVREALERIIDDYKLYDNLIIAFGDDSLSSDVDLAIDLSRFIKEELGNDTNSYPPIISASEFKDYGRYNIISIGGPCGNSVTEKLTNEFGLNCNDWELGNSESVIKVLEYENKIGLILAGTNQNETDRLVLMVHNYSTSPSFEKGNKVIIGQSKSISSSFAEIKSNNLPTYIVVGINSDDQEAAFNLKEFLGSENIFINNDTAQILEESNLISIGGPCVNTVTENFIDEEGYNCNDWRFKSNKSVLLRVDKENGVALVIAGTNRQDTYLITKNLFQITNQASYYVDGLIVSDDLDTTDWNQYKSECTNFLCKINKQADKSLVRMDLGHEKKVFGDSFANPSLQTNNCFECFLQNMNSNYLYLLINHIGGMNLGNDFSEAEKRVLIGRITDNNKFICSSIPFYLAFLDKPLDSETNLIVYEDLLMLSFECLTQKEQFYYGIKAIELSEKLGYKDKAKVYKQLISKKKVDVDDSFQFDIKSKLKIPNNPKYIVIGKSFINISSDSIITGQIERIVRDWSSLNLKNSPRSNITLIKDNLAENEVWTGWPYMEGMILKDIINYSGASFTPIWNTVVVQKGVLNYWYASDDEGNFMFRILEDKIQYPTTKCAKNVCLLSDTHGISALVSKAIKYNSSLVIGCGDYYDKMYAAYYLSKKGINVLTPPDRYIGMTIGHDGKGVILGSAPVNKVGDSAIIGDQPIKIGITEKIIVQTTSKPYPAQYYDAPERYFKSLEKISGFNLDLVIVDTPDIKQTYKVIEKAKSLNAHVVAVRVGYDEDYEAIKNWLIEDKNNRAVLFHSSPYISGYRLLKEFSSQTTFGDPQPIFE
ncbi:MAG: S-layer protein [archaeon]